MSDYEDSGPLTPEELDSTYEIPSAEDLQAALEQAMGQYVKQMQAGDEEVRRYVAGALAGYNKVLVPALSKNFGRLSVLLQIDRAIMTKIVQRIDAGAVEDARARADDVGRISALEEGFKRLEATMGNSAESQALRDRVALLERENAALRAHVEDLEDAREADAALAEMAETGEKPIPLDEAKRQLGL